MSRHNLIFRVRDAARRSPPSRPLRHFCSSPTSPAANPLINLAAYANTRENKWFAKATGISPIEFSPQLQLIRSSEGLDKHARRPQEQLQQAAQAKSTPQSAQAGTSSQTTAPSIEPPQYSASVAASVGQQILDQHETERRTLLEKITHLERLAKDQADTIASLTNKLQIAGGTSSAARPPKNSTFDLLLIILGVASATSFFVLWGKDEEFKSGLLKSLTEWSWKPDFGTSREIETVIFNTLPGQMHLLGISGSAKAFITAPADVQVPVNQSVEKEVFFESALQGAADKDNPLAEAVMISPVVKETKAQGPAPRRFALHRLFWTGME